MEREPFEQRTERRAKVGFDLEISPNAAYCIKFLSANVHLLNHGFYLVGMAVATQS
jgi:hypothetical protein